MSEHTFGPLRSRAARKPWPECPDVAVYRCRRCGKLYQELGPLEPQADADKPPVSGCCGEALERLVPLSQEDIAPDILVDYKVVGGFNADAVQVFWESAEDRPEWILLKTFTGGYLKYVSPKKVPPLVFPMADEDAYVYCDREVCQRCVFRCKRGFVIYLYFKTKGLVEIPLDRMADYFETKA